MRETTIHPPEPLADEERVFFRKAIDEYGVMIIGGCAGQRADRLIVSYSIGLTERGWPEIAVSGVRQQTAYALINMLIDYLGQTKLEGDAIFIPAFSNEYDICLRRLPSEEASEYILTKARDFYEKPVEVMQMVMADKDGRMPWEEGGNTAFQDSQCPMVDWRAAVNHPPANMVRLPPPPWSEAAKASSAPGA